MPKGEEQVKHFIEERLVFQKVAITEKITKNNFPLLNKTVSPNSTMNFGPAFMNRFRCAVEHRPSLADLVFAEELYGVPHCFAVNVDTMYHGSKSSIKDRLKPCHPPIGNETSPAAIILEAMIRKLANVSVKNFLEFAVVLNQNVSHLAKGFDRVDIVFDRYFESSLKKQTRMERGLGGSWVFNIDGEESFPKNFQESFLHLTENKNDLGLYLAPKLISLHQVFGSSHLQLCVTYRDTIISTPEMNNRS